MDFSFNNVVNASVISPNYLLAYNAIGVSLCMIPFFSYYFLARNNYKNRKIKKRFLNLLVMCFIFVSSIITQLAADIFVIKSSESHNWLYEKAILLTFTGYIYAIIFLFLVVAPFWTDFHKRNEIKSDPATKRVLREAKNKSSYKS